MVFVPKSASFIQISARSTCTHLHHSELDSGSQCHLKTVETFSAYPKTTWCADSAALVSVGVSPDSWVRQWVRVHKARVRVRVRVHHARVRVHQVWVRVHWTRVRVQVHWTRVRVRVRVQWVRVRVRVRESNRSQSESGLSLDSWVQQ